MAEGRSAHAQARAQGARRPLSFPASHGAAEHAEHEPSMRREGPQLLYFLIPSIMARTIAICDPVFFAKSGLS